MRKFFDFFSNPLLLVESLGYRGFLSWMSDETYLKIVYKAKIGKTLNLNNPQTFNEKLQWLKLYDRKPEYTTMVDKYAVKKYVADKIGEQYIIPTLGVWERFADIDFDKLPYQFVLKCTHDSGGLVICRDKSKFDIEAARKKINRSLKRNYYYSSREWPYKNVKPRIIAEQYMEDKTDGELRDYKFYCFDGFIKALLLATSRQSEGGPYFDYFDYNFNHLALTDHWHKNATKTPHKPSHFDEMVRLSKVLSKGIPHVRVDFYEANGHVYFGELTFYDMGGYSRIHPDEWEVEWGDLIKLPKKRGKNGKF